jgi:hypothetical protein
MHGLAWIQHYEYSCYSATHRGGDRIIRRHIS